MLQILVIGGGGREHALAWKCARSASVSRVFVAPGNAGTATEAGLENVAIQANDLDSLVSFARDHHIDLTIVGPEIPLVAGIVDQFQQAGLPIFGPTRAAAQLEGSKAFSKDFLQRHHIPTAEYQVFTETGPAIAYIRQQGAPIVVKADGLAAGKGVIVATDEQQAIDAVNDMLAGNAFGQAGSRVVVEQFLQGEEASYIVMVDGEHILPLATSQDHKARDNADQGPNTGGMGAYTPAPVITAELDQRIMNDIIKPTVQGMAADGIRYTGFLYAGVMIDSQGNPRVLEYNCRFGDPETQPIMMRLLSDLPDLCLAAIAGRLHEKQAEWDPRAALGVVMAAGGYPGDYRQGDQIDGLQSVSEDCKVFHAGTRCNDEQQVVTAGGRVLCVTALGDTVAAAQQQAYACISKVTWPDAYYRTDIGYRAIQREQNSNE